MISNTNIKATTIPSPPSPPSLLCNEINKLIRQRLIGSAYKKPKSLDSKSLVLNSLRLIAVGKYRRLGTSKHLPEEGMKAKTIRFNGQRFIADSQSYHLVNLKCF